MPFYLHSDLCVPFKKAKPTNKTQWLGVLWEIFFQKWYLRLFKVICKETVHKPTSADRESWLTITMAQDFMGGERISNKRGQHLYLWFSFLTSNQTCFSPSPPKSRGCETPQTLKKFFKEDWHLPRKGLKLV